MKIIKKGSYNYLSHFFRKAGKVIHREKYIGKTIPANIEEIKEIFLRSCLEKESFKRCNQIKKNFRKEWKSLPESVKKKRLLQFSIEFTYNTNAIEGSTITLEETEEIIKRHMAVNKSLYDVQETINHSNTFFEILQIKDELDVKLLLHWHRQLFNQTKQDIAGRLREYLVRVGSYIAPDWQDVPTLMKEFISWYNKNKETMHPVELAARAHYKFEMIHPFGDGNGRIGRLIINHILKTNHFQMLLIEFKKRKMYYKALSKEENDFLIYFVRMYMQSFKRYL